VREQHLVDEAVGEQGVLRIELDLAEDLEGSLADLIHVGADLVGAQDRKLASDLPRLLDRVVELAQVTPQRLAPADPLDEPELLEVGDVPEIPDQRTEDRVVDPVELLVGERLDQLQGVTTRFLQPLGQLGLGIGSGTSTTLRGCGYLRDRSRLPRHPPRLVGVYSRPPWA
jgi:hypothetical protein